MVKVGDKVKIEAVRNGGILAKVHDLVTVTDINHVCGFMATTSSGADVYVCYDFDDSCADYLAGPIVTNETQTETEAERRGAKFGVMGVSKITGRKIRFVADDGKKSLNGQPLWVFLNDETQSIMRLRPSEVRFEHEPEYVAWSEAPEHLRYDASRVYCEGKPVKWVAKPEGAFTDVVVVLENGVMEFSSHKLTVKL